MNRDHNARQRRPFVAVAFTTVAVSLLCGCGSRNGDRGSEALATVDGEAVTAAQFAHHWEARGGAGDSASSRRAVLDDLLRRKALAQRARAAGLDSDPEVVAQFENLLVRRLREEQLEPRCAAVKVGDDEVAAWYQTHRSSRFAVPARDRLAVLWFNTRGHAPLADRYRPRLEAARGAILGDPAAFPAEAGFGRLAVECSEHRASRYRGGDLGWVETPGAGEESVAGGFSATVAEIGRGLREPGDVSPVTDTGDGLVVVRLIDRQVGGVKGLEDVRDEVRRHLLTEKRRALVHDFEASALAGANVERHDDRLQAVSGLATPDDPRDVAAPGAIAAISKPGAPLAETDD